MDIFQEVKNYIPTTQAYTHYSGELRKKGRIHWGLCPWHKEKTPSFAIYEDNGFKCYGCGEGGIDSIAFVAKLFHLSMIDAVKKLIEDFALPIEVGNKGISYKPTQEQVILSDFMAGLKQWRNQTFDNLCRLYRITSMLLKVVDWEEETFAELVQFNADLDAWTDILIHGDMLDIFGLYKKLKGKGWG